MRLPPLKEIGGEAGIDGCAVRLQPIGPVAPQSDRQVKIGVLPDFCAVDVVGRISAVNVAVQAAGTDFPAAMPRVPNRHCDLLSLTKK